MSHKKKEHMKAAHKMEKSEEKAMPMSLAMKKGKDKKKK